MPQAISQEIKDQIYAEYLELKLVHLNVDLPEPIEVRMERVNPVNWTVEFSFSFDNEALPRKLGIYGKQGNTVFYFPLIETAENFAHKPADIHVAGRAKTPKGWKNSCILLTLD